MGNIAMLCCNLTWKMTTAKKCWSFLFSIEALCEIGGAYLHTRRVQHTVMRFYAITRSFVAHTMTHGFSFIGNLKKGGGVSRSNVHHDQFQTWLWCKFRIKMKIEFQTLPRLLFVNTGNIKSPAQKLGTVKMLFCKLLTHGFRSKVRGSSFSNKW